MSMSDKMVIGWMPWVVSVRKSTCLSSPTAIDKIHGDRVMHRRWALLVRTDA